MIMENIDIYGMSIVIADIWSIDIKKYKMTYGAGCNCFVSDCFYLGLVLTINMPRDLDNKINLICSSLL